MNEVGSTTTTGGSPTPTASSQSLIGNYELFLTLLTTQIQNQDPLDPLDSAEYTNQLVQYSSVEQSIQTNQFLESMMASLATSQASSYVNYLGSEVTASGDTSMLQGGSASWSYSIAEDATGAVEIKNASGAVIYSGDVELSAGSDTFEWDGVGNGNTASPDGAYTISFDVKNSADSSESVNTEISGIVSKVDLSTGSAFLTVGGVSVPVTAVKSVRSAT